MSEVSAPGLLYDRGRIMVSRRQFLPTAAVAAPAFLSAQSSKRRPNILFAIADDWSYAHAGAMGDKVVKTPAFDEIAGRGVLFTNAVCGSPGCAPSRAAILTGRPHWQLEEAGTHASLFPKKFQVYPDILAAAGYFTGLTGKGAGPANFTEWKHNPSGPVLSKATANPPAKGMSSVDYAGNFEAFLAKKQKDQPFCFWYGCQEPHRAYEKGSGLRSGKKLADVVVPAFLPDTEEIRSDILDYYFEIEHFDRHLGRMLRALEKSGELSNTLIVVTGDNGMAFPGAKASMYDFGIHLPLAICWADRFKGSRRVTDPVSFVDFAPTYLAAAGLKPSPVMAGQSLLPVLESGRVDPSRRFAISGRERHSHSRFDNLGYPTRALRTSEYLYIRNFAPDRWPAGDPDQFADIDGSPSKDYVVKNRDKADVRKYFEHACGKHGEEQLYSVVDDPGCMVELSASPKHRQTRTALRAQLDRELTWANDPRVLGKGQVFDSYPRFSPMRPELGGFAEQGKYNPKYQK